jgi:hypothetical protein
MLTESLCPDCKAPVMTVDRAGGRPPLVVDRDPRPDGNVVIKGDDQEAKATRLASAERAIKLLELAGVPEADRHRAHRCPKSAANHQQRRGRRRRGRGKRHQHAR